MTGVIDTHVGGAMVVLDIVNAFLQADNNGMILMLLLTNLAVMMAIIDLYMY